MLACAMHAKFKYGFHQYSGFKVYHFNTVPGTNSILQSVNRHVLALQKENIAVSTTLPKNHVRTDQYSPAPRALCLSSMSSCNNHHLASRRINSELSTYPLRLDHTVEVEASETSTSSRLNPKLSTRTIATNLQDFFGLVVGPGVTVLRAVLIVRFSSLVPRFI